MKKFYLVAVAALSLASCSNDDVVDLQQDEIKFNAVAENTSRAVDIYCNNNMPEDFTVYAYWLDADGKANMYISGDLVKKSGSSYVSTVARYWPEETLNFIAVKNIDLRNFYPNQIGNLYNSYSVYVNDDVAQQVDMLVAVTKNQTKAANAAGGVNLNFRHALSQIVFSAKNSYSNLHVEVSGVKVGNISNGGQLNVGMSYDETTGNYEDHEGNVSAVDLDGAITWYGVRNFLDPNATTAEEYSRDYTVEFANPIEVGAELVSLTSANAEGKEFSNTAMLLVPQTATAWDKETYPDATTTDHYGTFLAVNCTIWNIAGDTFNETTDTKVYEGWAYVPVDIDWRAGKKYTYTFVFGGDILDPITYNVTVDDFQTVANQDVEVDVVD